MSADARPGEASVHVAYAQEPLEDEWPRPFVFLAGPTPREETTPSWRPEAIRLVAEGGVAFAGTLVVPESRYGGFRGLVRDRQEEWEWTWLDAADAICFWVPREMSAMPALTTNIEYGLYVPSGKCVLGTPPHAVHVGYLSRLAVRFGVPVFDTLEETLAAAAALATENARRHLPPARLSRPVR